MQKYRHQHLLFLSFVWFLYNAPLSAYYTHNYLAFHQKYHNFCSHFYLLYDAPSLGLPLLSSPLILLCNDINIFVYFWRIFMKVCKHLPAIFTYMVLYYNVSSQLERKYSHNRHLRYEESEQVAISWYLRQRKERPLEPLFGKWSDPNMYHLLHFVVK